MLLNPNRKRVLGVDPGSNKMGLAVLEFNLDGSEARFVHYYHLRPKKGSLAFRLREIDLSVTGLLETWKPVAIGMEKTFAGGRIMNPHTMSQTGKVAGVVERRAADHVPLLFELAFSSAKAVLVPGRGGADYPVLRALLKAQYGLDDVEQIEEDVISAMVHAHATMRVIVTKQDIKGIDLVLRPTVPVVGKERRGRTPKDTG